MLAQYIVFILFFFALGASIGSFLNVVVWRLPRNESLVRPRSHCPKCNHLLAARDNIPIFGWLALRGRCRYCGEPISARYPIVELATGILFVLYYVCYFIFQLGPCHRLPLFIQDVWPIFALYLFMLACLLAASLIDAELLIIPLELPYVIAGAGIIIHTIIDRPLLPGSLNLSPTLLPLSIGASAGLLLSIFLWYRGIFPTSFAKGEPLLEVDRAAALEEKVPPSELPPEYTRAQIREEISKEMLFLSPALVLGGLMLLLNLKVPAFASLMRGLDAYWFTALFGSLLGAMVGGFTVWITRILGTLGFGRVAMGLGDVHLMFGVGAVIGAAPSVVAFFLAPFFGLVFACYFLITGKRREIPFGPYLSLGSAASILFFCPIATHFTPGLQALMSMLTGSQP